MDASSRLSIRNDIENHIALLQSGVRISSLLPIVIRHYKPLDKLGSGSHGGVYLMEHTKTNQQVAMKIQESRTALNELKMLKELQEVPGISKVLDFFKDGYEYFIAFPVYACSLLRVGHQYSKDLILRVGIDLFAILKDLHGQGIVHRDIKPANVMIDPEGSTNRLILCDFGISRRFKKADGSLVRTFHKDRDFRFVEYFSPGMDGNLKVSPLDDVIMVGFCMMTLFNFRPFRGIDPVYRRNVKLVFLKRPEMILTDELEFLLPIIKKIGGLQSSSEIDYDDLVATLKEGMSIPIEAGTSYPLTQNPDGSFRVE